MGVDPGYAFPMLDSQEHRQIEQQTMPCSISRNCLAAIGSIAIRSL